MTRLLLKTVFWFAMAMVAVLSLMPVEHLPAQALDIWDKAQHAGGFALLTLLGGMAYRPRRLQVWIGLLAYGTLIEMAQSATGWRHGDLLDLLADSVGILLGAAIMAVAQARQRRSHPQ